MGNTIKSYQVAVNDTDFKIQQMISLIELNINHNEKITHESICKLKNLKILYMDNNLRIPGKCLNKLHHLQVLGLNKIEFILLYY